MHRLNYLFRQGRKHKYAYDEETLGQLFRTAGSVTRNGGRSMRALNVVSIAVKDGGNKGDDVAKY
jgi:hypothetical protein